MPTPDDVGVVDETSTFVDSSVKDLASCKVAEATIAVDRAGESDEGNAETTGRSH